MIAPPLDTAVARAQSPCSKPTPPGPAIALPPPFCNSSALFVQILANVHVRVGLSSHEGLKESIPLRRFGHVEEVADAAAFLAKNPYASNCILNLDGGLSAT